MATAKLLQKPKIVSIVGSSIRIAHPDLYGYIKTYLNSPIAAGATAMSVYDNNGFADDDWFIIGVPGDSQTEENDVNGAVTRGTAVTVTNTLKFSHEIDAPVTKILERKIKIYGAATDGGAGTLITSIDALTGDATPIKWDKPFTEYTLISTDTTYAYYYVKFTDGTTDSDASDYVLAAGLSSSSVESIIQAALGKAGIALGEGGVTRPLMVSWVNEAQDAIAQFMYRDPLSQRYRAKDWSFEIVKDVTTLALTRNENEYALSGLTITPKYSYTAQSFISVQIGDRDPMKQITPREMDQVQVGQHRTELSVAANAGDTTLTVDSTAGFPDSGTLYVGTDSGVTYTAKTSTTFTGVPASGTGAITATQAIDSIVLNGRGPGVPRFYTIDNQRLRFDVGADSTCTGEKIKVRYYRKLTALTEASDTTIVPFTNVISTFLESRIWSRKKKLSQASAVMKMFEDSVLNNCVADQSLAADSISYYNFESWDENFAYDDAYQGNNW